MSTLQEPLPESLGPGWSCPPGNWSEFALPEPEGGWFWALERGRVWMECRSRPEKRYKCIGSLLLEQTRKIKVSLYILHCLRYVFHLNMEITQWFISLLNGHNRCWIEKRSNCNKWSSWPLWDILFLPSFSPILDWNKVKLWILYFSAHLFWC